MKTSDLVSNSSLGQMTPDDVLGLVQDRLASSRTGLMHVQMHKQLLERAVAAERERCAKICADIAGEVDWSARGIMQMDAEQVGIECAKQIRGEQ